jgi:tripartite-type tricarboxylate transporter receptor subunit TctC
VFPPDVPAERVALMRQAFAEVGRDPQVLAEAEKANIDMTYIAPARLEELIENLYRTPPDLIEAVKRLVPNLQ